MEARTGPVVIVDCPASVAGLVPKREGHPAILLRRSSMVTVVQRNGRRSTPCLVAWLDGTNRVVLKWLLEPPLAVEESSIVDDHREIASQLALLAGDGRQAREALVDFAVEADLRIDQVYDLATDMVACEVMPSSDLHGIVVAVAEAKRDRIDEAIAARRSREQRIREIEEQEKAELEELEAMRRRRLHGGDQGDGAGKPKRALKLE